MSYAIEVVLKNTNDTNHTSYVAKCENNVVTVDPFHDVHTNQEYLKDLCKNIADLEINQKQNQNVNIKTKKYEFDNNQYIQGTIFARCSMTSGSYFYVIEESNTGPRFCLYVIFNTGSDHLTSAIKMTKPNIYEERVYMKNKLYENKIDPQYILNEELYFL
jgi:hypothetical protein